MTEQAKERLLKALVSITAERGLDQVSIREVAAGAGVSIGTVQYYCRSKDDMLEMAFRHILDRMVERVERLTVPGRVGPAIQAGATASSCLWTTPDARECRVYLAFAARAAVCPRLHRPSSTSCSAACGGRCADAFEVAIERDGAGGTFEPEGRRGRHPALVDGLLLHMLTDPTGLRAKQALALLDEHLRRYVVLDAPEA